jgi:hypothetical protein
MDEGDLSLGLGGEEWEAGGGELAAALGAGHLLFGQACGRVEDQVVAGVGEAVSADAELE